MALLCNMCNVNYIAANSCVVSIRLRTGNSGVEELPFILKAHLVKS